MLRSIQFVDPLYLPIGGWAVSDCETLLNGTAKCHGFSTSHSDEYSILSNSPSFSCIKQISSGKDIVEVF